MCIKGHLFCVTPIFPESFMIVLICIYDTALTPPQECTSTNVGKIAMYQIHGYISVRPPPGTLQKGVPMGGGRINFGQRRMWWSTEMVYS